MQTIQNRRRFLASISAAGAIGLVGARTSTAEEAPLETTAVRFVNAPALCLAPQYLAEERLRADGFQFSEVAADAGVASALLLARGEADFCIDFASGFIIPAAAGEPIKMLAGLHSGCYQLVAQDGIDSVLDLKGKRVGAGVNLKSDPYVFVSAMLSYVGLDPRTDIEWVTSAEAEPMQLFMDGKVDAFLCFGSECPALREGKIGRVIVSGALDRPWSQYFCCLIAASANFVQSYPVATKRVLRTIFDAADRCIADPAVAARVVVERGYAKRYDLALEAFKEIRYSAWREFDPEDTVRFFSLRLHENGMIESGPQEIIAKGTDWRFLNELKREM